VRWTRTKIIIFKTLEAVYNFQTQTVEVANSRSNTVSVIDPIRKTVVDTINVGRNPRGLASDMSGKLYVANSGSNTVSVFDFFNVPIKNISVGRNPTAVTTDSNHRTIYVTNSVSNTVSVISSTTTPPK
jgi:YVTN family beta-propeller protein